MRITKVEACTCVIPLGSGVAFSTRALRERHFTLVRVLAGDGAVGLGYCYSGHKAGHLTTLAVRDLLRDVLTGRDPLQIEGLWDAMYREALLHGRRGLVLRAMSAVDIALWDLASKEAGLPLYRYLGAHREEAVPVYASGGYYFPGRGLEDLAREMEGYLERGYRAVKMKVGRLSPREDARRLEVVRQTVGEETPVFLDANNAWPDATAALEAIRRFEPYEPGWVEEPLAPDDIPGHARLRRDSRVPVATGEVHATRWEFRDLVERGAADVLQPDAGVCGGVTEWRRIAALAAAHDIPVAPHWLPEVHQHLVAATPNAVWVEHILDTGVINLALLFKTGLEVRDGHIVLPSAPGLGVELDEAAVDRWSVDGWA